MHRLLALLLLAASARAEITAFGSFPGGADQTIQFNDGSVFGGVPGSSVAGGSVTFAEVRTTTGSFGAGGVKSTFTYNGSLVLSTAATITGVSSITASAFFGDASHLTNLPSSGTVFAIGQSTQQLAVAIATTGATVYALGLSSAANGLAISTSAAVLFAMGQSTAANGAAISTVSATLYAVGQSTLQLAVAISSTDAVLFTVGQSTQLLAVAISTTGAAKVNRAGDTMTGALAVTTLTVSGNAFSVGASTLVVRGGNVGVGTTNPSLLLHVNGTGTSSVLFVEGDGATSESIAHFKDVGVQGPALDFWSSNQRWAFMIRSNGNFAIRNSGVGTDPVNGTTLMEFMPNGTVFFSGVGQVGIGASAPTAALEISTTITNGTIDGGVAKITRYSDDTFAGAWIGQHARGTSAAPTALLTNDDLAAFGGRAYDGVKFSTMSIGLFRIIAEEDQTPTAWGTYFTWLNSRAGTNLRREVMRLDSRGQLGIGTTPYLLLDVNGAAQFGRIARSTFTDSGALLMASGSSVTLSGPNGYLTGASSVTASAFFGDGSHLTGVSGSGNFVYSTGSAMTGQLVMAGSSVALTGSEGVILGQSSITASAFFGDGSHLSNLPSAETNTFTSSKTFTSDVLGKSSVTANAFFGDGSHLTGLSSSEGTTFSSSKTFTATGGASVQTSSGIFVSSGALQLGTNAFVRWGDGTTSTTAATSGGGGVSLSGTNSWTGTNTFGVSGSTLAVDISGYFSPIGTAHALCHLVSSAAFTSVTSTDVAGMVPNIPGLFMYDFDVNNSATVKLRFNVDSSANYFWASGCQDSSITGICSGSSEGDTGITINSVTNTIKGDTSGIVHGWALVGSGRTNDQVKAVTGQSRHRDNSNKYAVTNYGGGLVSGAATIRSVGLVSNVNTSMSGDISLWRCDGF